MKSFRPATERDLPAMMAIVADAQAFIATLGIDQWQDGYPDEAVLRGDILAGNGYVLEGEAGEPLGIVTVLFDREPTYDEIFDGAWTAGEPYACLHRVAVSGAQRGKGVAAALMAAAEQLVVERGFPSIRIDTHRGNVAMLRMLEKCGFARCGVIYLENGAERIALEKKV